MTRGSIIRNLIMFSLPLVISGLLQQLYSWADAVVVGNFVGEAQLAAVSATGTLYNSSLMLIGGFASGISILVARSFGSGDIRTIEASTPTFTAVLGSASLAVTALLFFLTRPLLTLLNTPADMMPHGIAYFRIILIGVPFMAVYNIYTAVLRGVGDSRTALYSIIISSVSNVLLDLLFVAVFSLGVSGAAAATLMSQAAMTVFIVVYAGHHNPSMVIRPSRGMIDRHVLNLGLRLALPSAFQAGLKSIGMFMLQNILNSFGTQTVAGISSAYRIDSLALLPVNNIAGGVATFTGQNSGAKNYTRMKKGFKTGIFLTTAMAVAVTAIIIPLGPSLMRMFGISEAAVAIGYDFLLRCSVFYVFFGVVCAMAGFVQGHGSIMYFAAATIISLVIRVILSYTLAGTFGSRIVAYSEIVSWIFLVIAFGVRSFMLIKRDNALAAEAARQASLAEPSPEL